MRLARHLIFRSRQTGVAALLLMLVLIIGVGGWLVSGLSSAKLEIERNAQTTAALAEAKEGLISYAANDPGAPKPGSLPCPDIDNDGDSEVPEYSGANCTDSLGRLPYETLGLPDLRDADGERLWYALSNNFNANTTSAINSDTTGQLAVTGMAPATNVIAIIFSPGPALSAQVRNTANVTDATHFLEGENTNVPPNSNYLTGIASSTFNDRLLTIVADELFAVVEKRVVKEVERALNDYYTSQNFLPRPARFDDTTCLGTGSINTWDCNSDPSSDRGRIPANGVSWIGSSDILRGGTPLTWFQANGWRELIYYAPGYACTNPGGPNCTWCSLNPFDPRCSVATGAGFVTVNVPPGTPLANQKLVLVAAGRARPPTQVRGSNLEKTTLGNYVELENANGDNTYVRDVVSVNLNDRVVSIP